MNHKITEMQTEIRSEFEKVIEHVTGTEAQDATAYQIEKGLFQLLLLLGCKLMCLFFAMRSEKCTRDEFIVGEHAVPYNREQQRIYSSIFGKVEIRRPYFYKAGIGGYKPLDKELHLGVDSYSEFLRETVGYLSVYMPYNKVTKMLKKMMYLNLSTRVVQKIIAQIRVRKTYTPIINKNYLQT